MSNVVLSKNVFDIFVLFFIWFLYFYIYIFTICTNVAQLIALHLHILLCIHFYQHIVIENALLARTFLGFWEWTPRIFLKLIFSMT